MSGTISRRGASRRVPPLSAALIGDVRHLSLEDSFFPKTLWERSRVGEDPVDTFPILHIVERLHQIGTNTQLPGFMELGLIADR